MVDVPALSGIRFDCGLDRPNGTWRYLKFCVYSNLRSYRSAAINTTKHEPALCTSAPVVGVSTCMSESTIAAKLMHMESVMLALIVRTVALDSRFRYGILERSSPSSAISAASTAISLPMFRWRCMNHRRRLLYQRGRHTEKVGLAGRRQVRDTL